MSPARSLITATVCGAALLAGCGDDGLPDDVEVRRTLDAYGKAAQKRDYPKVCEAYAARVHEALNERGLPCEQAMEIAFGKLKGLKLTVGKVKVDGDRASADVRSEAKGQKPSTDVIRLVREDGDWRISELASQ